jgi:hypothetical protein
MDSIVIMTSVAQDLSTFNSEERAKGKASQKNTSKAEDYLDETDKIKPF